MATAPAQFDLAGAKQAGYSDDEIIQHLAQSRNFDVQGALSAGYTKPEILAHLSSSTTSGKGLTKPTSPPGFVAGLGHALGAPTTPEEAASMISSPEHPAWDTGSTIGGFNPGAAVENIVSNVGQGVSKAVRGGAQETNEAVRNIREGGPIFANLGKAAYGYLSALSSVNPVVAAGGETGKEVAKGNISGAAGSAVGGLLSGVLAGESLGTSKELPKPATRVNKTAYAIGAGGSYVDFPTQIQKAMPALDAAAARLGKPPATVGDLQRVTRTALADTETEFSQALQPIAGQQVVPNSIANDIRSRINPAMLKTADGRRTANLLNNIATEYEQPWTIQELNQARMDANARLASFENADVNVQTGNLRVQARTMADKAIADGTRDIVYDSMERYHGRPEYFRDLKQRQSALKDVNQQLDNHIRELKNVTATQKGTPLLSQENVSIYGHPGSGRIGASVHRLQHLFTTPIGGANRAVQKAFPSTTSANVYATPLAAQAGAQAASQNYRTPQEVMLAAKEGRITPAQARSLTQRMGKGATITRPMEPPR